MAGFGILAKQQWANERLVQESHWIRVAENAFDFQRPATLVRSEMRIALRSYEEAAMCLHQRTFTLLSFALYHFHQAEWTTSITKLSDSFAPKKSAGLAPGATFGPVKNLDVLTVDQNPESLLCPSRCSATLSAKEMPLTKHLIYRDSKSYFLANFVSKLDTNTKSNHPPLNHWLDSRIGQRKCNV